MDPLLKAGGRQLDAGYVIDGPIPGEFFKDDLEHTAFFNSNERLFKAVRKRLPKLREGVATSSLSRAGEITARAALRREAGSLTKEELQAARKEMLKELDVVETEIASVTAHSQAHASVLTRLSAYYLSSQTTIEAVSAVPFPVSPAPLEEPAGLGTVVNVVIPAFPVPSEDTSFEHLFEFKSDPQTRKNLAELRLWMRDMASGKVPPKELTERLEWLVSEHDARLERHRLQQSRGSVETLVTTSLEVAENLVKLKWGEVAKKIFSFRTQQVALLEAEADSVGRAVSYLSRARSRFSNRRAGRR